MLRAIIILGMLAFISCTRNEAIYYEYNGITITRIDRGNQIYFYFGKCNEEKNSCPESYIKAEYSGLNSGMGGYIIFTSDGKAELVRVYDSFEKIGADSLLSLKEYDNIEFINWTDSIKGNYNNVIEVSDIIKLEKEKNLKNHSNVKVTYP